MLKLIDKEINMQLVTSACDYCGKPIYKVYLRLSSTIDGTVLREKVVEHVGRKSVLNHTCKNCLTNEDAYKAGYGSSEELLASFDDTPDDVYRLTMDDYESISHIFDEEQD